MKNSTLIKKAMVKGFKIAFGDIETSPWLSMGYGTRKLFLSHKQVLIPHKVTSCVFMSENTREITKMEWDFKGPIVLSHDGVKGGGDDTQITRAMVKELSKYDLVIAQNGDRFDFPQIQTRALMLRLPPIKNLITLDTLKLNRKSLALLSNKLDYLSCLSGAGGKIDQNMTDCIQTALGNPKISKARLVYNIKDVKDLRKVFWYTLDYVTLQDKTINMLRNFIKEDRVFCIKCAARRQKRFLVKKAIVKVKVQGKKSRALRYVCQNCDFKWRIKK